MSMRPRIRTRRQRRTVQGFLLVDVIIGMFFLVMTTLSLMSLFPVIKKGEQTSTEESKAIQMCNRMIEHIQMLGADDINITNLTALNLVDAGQSSQPLSFTHIPLDEASRYSPHQVLRDANGSITYSTITGGSVRVLVTLQYTSDTGATKTIRTGTVVGGFR